MRTMKPLYLILISTVLPLSGCGTKASSSGSLVHEHTFSSSWSKDEHYHWYEATCGHDVITDKEEHSYNEDNAYFEIIDYDTGETIKHNYCLVCNYESSEEHTHHFEVSYVVDQTFQKGGYTVYRCSQCGYDYEDDFTNPLEHNYSDVYSYGDTYHWRQCIDEGYTHLYTEMEEHTFVEDVIDPTFEQEGYTLHRCKKCDYSYKTDFTTVLEHNYSSDYDSDDYTHWHPCIDAGYGHLKNGEESHYVSDWTIELEPTDDDEGSAIGYCDVCHHECHKSVPSNKESSLEYLSFTKKSNSYYSVSLKDEYRLTPTRIIIPETYDDLNVTEINSAAFKDAINLRSILIPNTVRSILDQAFSGCEALEEINISNNVNQIGDEAFLNCSKIENIVIKDGLTNIGQNAFKGCYKLFDEYLNGHYIKSESNPYYYLVDAVDNSVTRFEVHPDAYLVNPGALKDLNALTYLKTPFVGKCKDASKVSAYERKFGVIFGYMALKDKSTSTIQKTFAANVCVCQYVEGYLAGYYNLAVGYFVPRNFLTVDFSTATFTNFDLNPFSQESYGYSLWLDRFVIPTCVTTMSKSMNIKYFYLGTKDQFLNSFGMDFYTSSSNDYYFYSEEASEDSYENNHLWRFVNDEICLWGVASINFNNVTLSGDYESIVKVEYRISNTNNIEYKNITFALYYGDTLVSDVYEISNDKYVTFTNVPFATGYYTIKGQIDSKPQGSSSFITTTSGIPFKKTSFKMHEITNVSTAYADYNNHVYVTYTITDPFNIINEEHSRIYIDMVKGTILTGVKTVVVVKGSGTHIIDIVGLTLNNDSYRLELTSSIWINNPDGSLVKKEGITIVQLKAS